MPHELHSGCDVLTVFGWGLLSGIRNGGLHEQYEVDLDWMLASGKRAMAYLNRGSIVKASKCPVGAGVLTVYGPGVCVDYDRKTDMHKVRLWQAHGQAGGSAVACLQASAIISILPTAVGLFARTSAGTGKVIGYSQTGNSFTVEMSDGTIEMVPQTDPELSSPEVKVLPAVEYLTEQTQRVWTSQMRNIILSEQSREVWSKFDGLWKQLQSGESSLQDVLSDRAMQMKDQLQGVNSEQLGASLRQQADQFVKDGKVREIVHQARVRLQEIVESEDARAKYSDAGWEQFMTVINQGKSQLTQLTDGTIDQERTLKGVHECFSAVNDLARSDHALSGLLGDLQTRRSELFQYTEKAAATRAGKTVGEGSKELASRVNNLWNSPELAQVKELSTRVLGKLTSGDSAGRTKAAELLQGAKQLIFRRMADSETGIVDQLNERLISYLQNWDSHASPWASSVDDRLTQTTLLLQMLGEGSISTEKAITSAQAHLSLESQSSWRLFASQRVEQVLLTMLQREELATGRSISGRELLARFETKRTAKSVTQSITRTISEKLPQNSVAAPVKKFLNSISSTGSVHEAMGAAVQSLDTDEAEDFAKQWLGTGEQVLSKLERWRGHDAVKGVVGKLQAWEMDDKVLRNIEELDTDAVLHQAETALTDAEARARLVNQLKDSMLDFLLQYLPSMSIPDVEGVRDDVEYAVCNLDMSGFKLQKEDVTVELWGQAAPGEAEDGRQTDDEIISIRAQNIAAKFERLHWKYRQLYFPYMQGAGNATAIVENAAIRLGFKLVRVPTNTLAELAKIVEATDVPSDGPLPQPPMPPTPSAHEVEGQTYESVLMLTSRDIMMETLTLVVEDTAFAWLINLLVSVFTDAIKDYICRMLVLTLTQNASHLLRVVNGFVHQYWGVVCKAMGIQEGEIPIASKEDMETLYQDAVTERDMKRAASLIAEQNVARDYTLALMETGPLGLHLDLVKPADMTPAQLSESSLRAGFLEISGSAEGSQAEKAIAKLSLGPYIKKAIVTAVNGKLLKNMPPQMGLQLIREASRPLYLDFKLEETSWRFLRDTKKAHVQAQAQAAVAAVAAATVTGGPSSGLSRSASEQYVVGSASEQLSLTPTASQKNGASAGLQRRKRPLAVIKVQFGEGPLGLKLKENRSSGGAIIVTGFARDAQGRVLQAEASGKVKEGMIMLAVGEQLTFGRSFEQCIKILKRASRPVEITFVPSPDRQVVCQEPPVDLELAAIQGHVMITAFKHFPGVLSRVPNPPKVGDVIVAINGVSLPTAAGYTADVQMLKDAQPPWSLRVTRQEKAAWSEHEFSITEQGKLGVALGKTKDGRPFIKSYKNLPGPAQQTGKIVPGAVLLQINATRIDPTVTPEVCFRLMNESPVPVKIYLRDMDLFMHLIRLRDGEENLDNSVAVPQS